MNKCILSTSLLQHLCVQHAKNLTVLYHLICIEVVISIQGYKIFSSQLFMYHFLQNAAIVQSSEPICMCKHYAIIISKYANCKHECNELGTILILKFMSMKITLLASSYIIWFSSCWCHSICYIILFIAMDWLGAVGGFTRVGSIVL